MKLKLKYIIILLFATAFTACKKDNYKAPQAELSGRLMYNGTEIHVEQDQVTYELWQAGFGKYAPIRSSFNQEGFYSAKLFNGTYKLVIPSGQGPFEWIKNAAGQPDSLVIELKGSQKLDLEVTPYYLVKNASGQAANGKISATIDLEKIITGAEEKDIERVTLYVNKTQFVSGNSSANIAQVTLPGEDISSLNGISLSLDVPELVPSQDYLFVRMGIKLRNVEDLLFSPLMKINL